MHTYMHIHTIHIYTAHTPHTHEKEEKGEEIIMCFAYIHSCCLSLSFLTLSVPQVVTLYHMRGDVFVCVCDVHKCMN